MSYYLYSSTIPFYDRFSLFHFLALSHSLSHMIATHLCILTVSGEHFLAAATYLCSLLHLELPPAPSPFLCVSALWEG